MSCYDLFIPLKDSRPPRCMISKWQGGASLVHLLWHFSLDSEKNNKRKIVSAWCCFFIFNTYKNNQLLRKKRFFFCWVETKVLFQLQEHKTVLIPTCSFYISVQTTFPFHILCMSGTSNTLWKICRKKRKSEVRTFTINWEFTSCCTIIWKDM